MKRLLKNCLIHAACLLIIFQGTVSANAIAAGGSEGDYSDIKGHWAEKTIYDMVSKGWIKGTAVDGHLRIQPDKDITRAEFIAVLSRTGKTPEAKGEARKFSDVNEGAWYKEALDRLSGSGLVLGYDDGTFKPGNLITRAEIASILCRAAGWETPENIKETGTLKMFRDVPDGKWYYNSVMANKLKGVISGYPDGTFGPMNKATRAEAFSMISRFAGTVGIPGSDPGTGSGKGSDGGDGKDSNGQGGPDTENGPGQGTQPEPGGEPGTIIDSVGFIAYDISGNAGEKVLFQFYGYGMKNLGKFDVKVSYDPEKVVAEAVVKGTIKQGNYLSADFSSADKGYITVHSSDESPADGDGRGIVFVLMFKAKASGKTVVALSGTKGDSPGLYDTEGNPLENVAVENGSISIQ